MTQKKISKFLVNAFDKVNNQYRAKTSRPSAIVNPVELNVRREQPILRRAFCDPSTKDPVRHSVDTQADQSHLLPSMTSLVDSTNALYDMNIKKRG